jgi:5-methylcytosine-specific restriction endonuclease McrA
MEFVLIFGAVCIVGWFLDKLAAKPPLVVPKEPQQAEHISPEQLQWEKLLREHFRKELELNEEVEKEEWRKKYREYLNSPRWKRVRKRVLVEADYTCSICGGRASQVHHRKYPRGHKAGEFKRENYEYLVAICAKCHMERHDL